VATPRKAALPLIEPARCTGCGRCVALCPPHVLWLESHQWRKRAVLHDAGDCTGCAKCAVGCPFGAITMHPSKRLPGTP
jgi:ferredoxin